MSVPAPTTTVYEDTMDGEELLSRMRSLNKKFKNACSQVILLNNQIEYLQVRYDGAVKANKRSYRYFLRLRLATLEGIRNMFYEYACRRADELDEMQEQLVQEGVIDSDYDMDDIDSDTNTDDHPRTNTPTNDDRHTVPMDDHPTLAQTYPLAETNPTTTDIDPIQPEIVTPRDHISDPYNRATSREENIQHTENINSYVSSNEMNPPVSTPHSPHTTNTQFVSPRVNQCINNIISPSVNSVRGLLTHRKISSKNPSANVSNNNSSVHNGASSSVAESATVPVLTETSAVKKFVYKNEPGLSVLGQMSRKHNDGDVVLADQPKLKSARLEQTDIAQ